MEGEGEGEEQTVQVLSRVDASLALITLVTMFSLTEKGALSC